MTELDKQLKGADLQVTLEQAQCFLRSKSYPETDNYWRAVKRYCEENINKQKFAQKT